MLSQRYLQKWTLAVLFVAFASSSSLSGKTIHQNDELIEGQSEIFFLINNLEFCNIHIQDVVLQKKHFLFWLGNEFLAFSINTYVPFWLFGCVGLVMTKGYLAFNIMQRHVHTTISDLPRNHTNLSKLSHHRESRPRHCKDFH